MLSKWSILPTKVAVLTLNESFFTTIPSMKLAKNILPILRPTIIWDYGCCLQIEYLIYCFHIHWQKQVLAFKLPKKKPVFYPKAEQLEPNDATDHEHQIYLTTALGHCSTTSSRLGESTQLVTANWQGNARPTPSATHGKEVERARRLDTTALSSPAQSPTSLSLETSRKEL